MKEGGRGRPKKSAFWLWSITRAVTLFPKREAPPKTTYPDSQKPQNITVREAVTHGCKCVVVQAQMWAILQTVDMTSPQAQEKVTNNGLKDYHNADCSKPLDFSVLDPDQL